MDKKLPINPLDTGLRNRCERRKRLAGLVRRVLRKRRTLVVVLWMAKVIWFIARLISGNH